MLPISVTIARGLFPCERYACVGAFPQAEGFFSILNRRRLQRGTFWGIVDLQAAINRYLKEHNADPKPFAWTKTAAQVLDQLARLAASSV